MILMYNWLLWMESVLHICDAIPHIVQPLKIVKNWWNVTANLTIILVMIPLRKGAGNCIVTYSLRLLSLILIYSCDHHIVLKTIYRWALIKKMKVTDFAASSFPNKNEDFRSNNWDSLSYCLRYYY
jgi:hypothetical protein